MGRRPRPLAQPRPRHRGLRGHHPGRPPRGGRLSATASDARPAPEGLRTHVPPAASGREADVWDALHQVEDPHIPVSLVELAMIVDVRVQGGRAEVDLTYPCLGCPAYGFVKQDVEDAAADVPGIEDVHVDVVWEPAWSKDHLAPDVREKMRDAGYAV